MTVLDRFSRIKDLLESPPADYMIPDNYARFGATMGYPGYDEFVRGAKDFYDEAKAATEAGKAGYTRVDLSARRVAYDYSTAEGSQKRGIYSLSGKPIAFLKPDIKASGFASATEELETFISSGKSAARER